MSTAFVLLSYAPRAHALTVEVNAGALSDDLHPAGMTMVG